MKHITYKFTDGSEIDIDNSQNATIIGRTNQFAFKFWKLACGPKTPKGMETAVFIELCEEMHKRHGIVLEHTDHFTGVTVNHFNNLMATAK